MFASLRKIENPFLRSTTAALTASSIVTIIVALAIGITKPRDESAHKFGVYSSLLSAACGALLSVIYGTSKESKKESAPDCSQQTANEGKAWQDWRNFVIVRKVKESQEITSFYLKPEDQETLPYFQPGQFLTIKLNIPGQARPVIRTYSLSDYTAPCVYYRLSIKRESSPQGLNVPPGIVSNFMHDQVQEGSIISAKPPNGKFFITLSKPLPAVLVSNGVGITPMIAMAKACSRLNPNKHIWFLHGARNGPYHAFRDEVMALAKYNPNLHIHFRYSRPEAEDEGYYHSTGYVDAALIQELVAPKPEKIYGSTDAEYFLCGSPSFLESLRVGLQESKVPNNRVFFESFGNGKKATSESTSVSLNNGKVGVAEVVFAQSGKTLNWHPEDGTILEFAEANGINPDFSCRAGICLTCMCQIKEGEVVYEEPPTGTPDPGSVLICVSRPKTSKIVLDL
ncbi:2Fe-2S iron-sulfur cluster-binding protein [Lyngbya aestuarii]|uniref:2Fe-2S iron-sulfur cluster-binding protein n=1 Tax=Lyngbya aestuarii TaxID=118322 RepID=UPI00403DAF13